MSIKSLNTCLAVINIINSEITFVICRDVVITQSHQIRITTVLTTTVAFKDIGMAPTLLEEIASQ